MNEDSERKMRGRSRGRTRGRARGGRTRGRTKKPMKIIESDEEENNVPTPDENQRETAEISVEQTETEDVEQIQVTREHQFDLEADISQLEAPTFTTINRGPPEPMLRLRWDHRVNLIGEKVLNPMIHCCDKCLKPILIYGRMIPCKHVFCLSCGKREDKVCPRCMEKVSRVEQTGLGTVFMCTHGGTRYGNAGCRRTYLSQRDLQAHINHRHISGINQIATQNDSNQYIHPKTEVEQPQLAQQQQQIGKISSISMQAGRIKQIPSHMVQPIIGNDPRVNSLVSQSPIEHRQQHRPQQLMPVQTYSTNSTSSINPPMRTNLITVPIQDTTAMQHDIHPQQTHHYYQPPSSQISYGYNVPLVPSQAQSYYSVQQHPTQVSYSTSVSQQQQQTAPQTQSQPQQQQQPSQQQFVASGTQIRSSANGYIQDNTQYSTPPPQQIPTAQSQWSQHQQFYR